jgi:hypothetical protein
MREICQCLWGSEGFGIDFKGTAGWKWQACTSRPKQATKYVGSIAPVTRLVTFEEDSHNFRTKMHRKHYSVISDCSTVDAAMVCVYMCAAWLWLGFYAFGHDNPGVIK